MKILEKSRFRRETLGVIFIVCVLAPQWQLDRIGEAASDGLFLLSCILLLVTTPLVLGALIFLLPGIDAESSSSPTGWLAFLRLAILVGALTLFMRSVGSARGELYLASCAASIAAAATLVLAWLRMRSGRRPPPDARDPDPQGV